jgi:alpha-D-xyloside xylohydrolase
MDIGGFSVEKRYENGQRIFDKTGVENADLKEWRELNTRWYQFGAFVPLFRAHGQFPFREPFNIAPENHPAYKSILYYDQLRYRLMPYIYSLAGMTFFNDYTIMRALVMDFAEDMNVTDIGDQYMFGTAFMVCPVYEYGARTRKVYFPNCEGWYDLYSGAFIDAKQWKTVDAPYDRMPIFVRAGSIVPFGPEIEYYNQKLPDEITLYVYDGQNGSFTLYEDEAVNYNYEKGKFSMIPFSFDNSTKTLTIGERKGSYDRMLQNRKFNVIFVQQNSPKSLDFETKGIEVKYSGEKVTIKL